MDEAPKSILLCSQDTLFVKGLYGPLRDEGYAVSTIEHPAEAVKCVLGEPYLCVILDSRDIGLDASDAAAIIKNIRPDIYIIVIGKDEGAGNFYFVREPYAIDQLKELINELSAGRLRQRA
jgi:DNA-binding NtrC family response regulator